MIHHWPFSNEDEGASQLNLFYGRSSCRLKDTSFAKWMPEGCDWTPHQAAALRFAGFLYKRHRSVGSVSKYSNLFRKLGSFDFHKRCRHGLQVTALIVEGDTSRTCAQGEDDKTNI